MKIIVMIPTPMEVPDYNNDGVADGTDLAQLIEILDQLFPGFTIKFPKR